MNEDNLTVARYGDATPGDIVTFGVYPQTAEGTDRTPIRWRVLQNSGTELFLLSASILDCQQYHGAFIETIWRDCDLRKWLNDVFYNAAFDTAEKRRVKTALCDDNGESSPNTEDRVFLLSVTEAKTLTQRHDTEPVALRRRAIGTEFATVKKANGCKLYVYNGSVSEDYITEDGIEKGCSWWWLRTQPGSSSRAAFVGPRSSIRSYCRVNRVSYGVRPALKIALE